MSFISDYKLKKNELRKLEFEYNLSNIEIRRRMSDELARDDLRYERIRNIDDKHDRKNALKDLEKQDEEVIKRCKKRLEKNTKEYKRKKKLIKSGTGHKEIYESNEFTNYIDDDYDVFLVSGFMHDLDEENASVLDSKKTPIFLDPKMNDKIKNTIFRYFICLVAFLFVLFLDYEINMKGLNYLDIFIYTLVSSLVYGIIAVLFDEYHAYAVFFLNFFSTIFFKELISTSYAMIIDVVGIFFIGLFKDREIYSHLKSTLIGAFALFIFNSGLYILVYDVIMQLDKTLGRENVIIMSILASFIKNILVHMILYIFLKIIPIRKRMHIGRYCKMKDQYLDYYRLRKIMKKKNVSNIMTVLLFSIVAFLTVFAIVSSNMLLPSLGNAVNVMNESGQKIENQDYHSLNFVYNYSGITYDIKLFIMLMCLAIPLTSIVNRILQKRITEPISNMASTMNRFIGKTDTNRMLLKDAVANLDIKSNDEIGELYEAVKVVTIEVTDQLDYLEREKTLINEVEVANRANKAKSDFLSSMSHEIRTPLNAILGMDEMIIRETDSEEILEYATAVRSSGNSLLNLINDILDFSRIEAGKLEIIDVDYDLSSLCNDLINTINVKAKNKNLDLHVNVNPDMPYLLNGDEIRIKQIIINILTNAVKYTNEGSITLNITGETLENDKLRLTVHVIDTGIGIKPEDMEKLYKPFERIEESRNRNVEGTGLGMSIVKNLLNLMDSRLEVSSEYGKGSDFGFSIIQDIVSHEAIGDFNKRYKESLKKLKKYQESFQAPEARILVVDDTPINLTVVEGLLKFTRIQIDTAESGFDAIDLCKENVYDLILLDHRMPKMDGIETLMQIRIREDSKNIKTLAIALTANAGAGAREEYIKKGFTDYIPKPINATQLESMLVEYLPEDKLLYPGDKGFVENGEANKPLENVEEDEFLKALDAIEGIDAKQALVNSGSKEILENVVKNFHEAIKDNADMIEMYYNENNIKDYTILVHALKSSARLIGAMDLSEQAKYLEQCGNEFNIAQIEEKTGHLLKTYREYIDKLQIFVDEENEEDKEEISLSDLADAYSAIKEMVSVDDFDDAKDIITQLNDYKIPDTEKEKYKEVVKAINRVDREKLLTIL
ncbi:ATP-binding protein [Lachnospira pectinoschiza]|uniref:Circadian input-output histidine kinase CikA n=1 Tax=Lachnospira pectinoschiza TaxID=28052 RepID=A0A1G9WPG7_9FIRM|nr:ATP-binding protein [Lachnospira pectinoschiza]SDM86287.1 Signal transduction histidine kinase [Lachnospira pectinoschiza]